ncbi:Regulatory protein soxS [Pantoea agglomerans]|uniref:Regulatory protein soxS n=1 Tax=Enterobacter agglomerans TaxID=549 RepID=A0A379AB44_ENTAG|nr:Regulatory protein soxS [Pantoea agglomerans]
MLSQAIKKQHINDLVEWIEANLTDDLNIDQITLKSGYSKWHMQRMFKEMTGQTLAAYTRKRRLTMAAYGAASDPHDADRYRRTFWF